MAQTIMITDDLDGSADAETVRFAYKGQAYEIDLAAKSIEKLEKALTPFINAARTPSGGITAGRRRARGSTPASSEKVDYLDPEHFGQLHRGRVTEEEATLVRDNLAQANQNRVAAGQPEINPADPKEKQRYKL